MHYTKRIMAGYMRPLVENPCSRGRDPSTNCRPLLDSVVAKIIASEHPVLLLISICHSVLLTLEETALLPDTCLCLRCSNVSPLFESLSLDPLRFCCSCCFFWFFRRANSRWFPPTNKSMSQCRILTFS